MIQRKMDFEVTLERDSAGIHYALKIINTDTQDIRLRRILGPEDFTSTIGKTLGPGQSMDITIKNLPLDCLSNVEKSQLPIFLKLIAPERQAKEQAGSPDEQAVSSYPILPELSLDFQTCRRADVYLPRSRGLLRHAGEFVD